MPDPPARWPLLTTDRAYSTDNSAQYPTNTHRGIVCHRFTQFKHRGAPQVQVDIILEPDSPKRFTELGLLAETFGFGAVWTANHVGARDPFMSFMPLAATSERIRMGPVAVSPFELHPVKMANQLLTLNEASAGRASIIVGGGGGA
ncbi:MAG: LLM class flavin-dependent oxidoreductase, partial [Gammaproteobacteria bacterium]|nr:LLM class flavin-dependent oxidoreductase [Gammaproteobacteria bacterium]